VIVQGDEGTAYCSRCEEYARENEKLREANQFLQDVLSTVMRESDDDHVVRYLTAILDQLQAAAANPEADDA